MKSPWKYLVGLASRSRTDEEESEIQPEAEVSEPEALLTPKEYAGAPADPTSAAADPALQTADEPVVASDYPVVPVGATEEIARIPPREAASVGGPAEPALPVKSRPRKVQRSFSKTSTRPVAVDEGIKPEEATSNVQMPQTLSDEISALDEEVRRLRRRLAEKLSLQNKQLERLLKRFDAR